MEHHLCHGVRVRVREPERRRDAHGEVALRGGRRLSYAEAGDARGVPLLFMYGVGACRFFVYNYDDVGKKLGVRLICADRPGVGGSSAQPRGARSFAGWADDVEELADALHLRCFGVFGFSLGALHALACAAHPRLSARIAGRVVVCAPWPPPDTPGSCRKVRLLYSLPRVATRHVLPQLLYRSMKLAGELERRRWGGGRAEAGAEEAEEAEAESAEYALQRAVMKEAGRRGAAALADELHMCSLDAGRLGFRLEEVWPTVRMYAGREDSLVDIQASRLLALRLPRCEYAEVPRFDHEHFLSLDAVHYAISQELDELVRAARMVDPHDELSPPDAPPPPRAADGAEERDAPGADRPRDAG